MRLLKFIERKKMIEEQNAKFIGIEIKQQRLRQSKTLEEVSRDICSASYVCKVERNDIKPNYKYVTQICERLNLSANNIETLKHLSILMNKITEAYYYDNEDEIKKIFNEVRDLNNFRANIIKLIYNIYFKNYLISQRLIAELESLTISMCMSDIMTYSLFKSVYQIRNYEFKESIVLLRYLIDNNDFKDLLRIIAIEYLVKAYFYTGSPNFLNYIDEAKILHAKYLNLDHLEELKFNECLYYFLKKDTYRFEKIIKDKTSNKYKNTIDLLKAILYDEKNLEKKEYISSFYDALYYFKSNKEIYNNFDKTRLAIHEILYLKYLENEENVDDLNTVIDELIPSSIKISNIFLIEGFTNIAVMNLKKISKYKQAVELYEKSYQQKLYIEKLW